jgi:hypothetical protein
MSMTHFCSSYVGYFSFNNSIFDTKDHFKSFNKEMKEFMKLSFSIDMEHVTSRQKYQKPAWFWFLALNARFKRIHDYNYTLREL